jgi:apolipoprotein N-acyltransferase
MRAYFQKHRISFSLLFSLLYLFYFLYESSWLATTTYHGIYIYFVWVFLGVLFAIPVLFWFQAIFAIQSSIDFYLICFSFPLIEWIRLYFLCGFPFCAIGEKLASTQLFSSITRHLGIYGCSFFCVLFLLSILLRNKKGLIGGFFSIISLFLFDRFMGQETFSEKIVKVQIVQPDLKIEEKTPLVEFQKTYISKRRQLELAFQGLKGIEKGSLDLLIFPEGAFPGYLDQIYIHGLHFAYILKDILQLNVEAQKMPLSLLQVMQTLSFELDIPVLFGALRYDEKKEGVFNSLVCVDGFSNPQIYDKRILLPFGEYIPLKIFNRLAQKYGITGSFERGEEKVINIRGCRVLPSVCYEDCFPLLSLKQNPTDVDFIVNVTNDGWFLPSKLPKNHAHLAKLRAIEFGIPILRGCENAQSGIGFNDGTYLETQTVVFQLDKKKTFYPVFQERWLILGFLICFIYKIYQKFLINHLGLWKKNIKIKFSQVIK